jgi:hypothetical protein
MQTTVGTDTASKWLVESKRKLLLLPALYSGLCEGWCVCVCVGVGVWVGGWVCVCARVCVCVCVCRMSL